MPQAGRLNASQLPAYNRHNYESAFSICRRNTETWSADMLDSPTPRDRIVVATFKLAETRGWRELSLGEIAGEAGIPLAELRSTFQSKGQILAAFSRAVDQAVLEKFEKPGTDAPRDRLFDVLITRFEIMQPYKAAMRRIRDDLGSSFGEALAQLRPALKSQYWMLAAAGISGEGGGGLLRVQGLLALYARVFPIWLDDGDPGLARTMAALDRRLRRGEAVLRGIARFRDGFEGVKRALRGQKERSEDSHSQGDAPASAAGSQQI
jgi:AcrR family transcriptional regulator